MIWNEELSASLDQSAGVVVFHKVELTRAQQLAQVLADKVSAMVEQNEKSLDNKLGGSTGWGDRGEGGKGDKREQVQERRGGRTGGRGGTSRGGRWTPSPAHCMLTGTYRSWSWWPIPTGVGQSDERSESTMIASPAQRRKQMFEPYVLFVRGFMSSIESVMHLVNFSDGFKSSFVFLVNVKFLRLFFFFLSCTGSFLELCMRSKSV